MQADNCCGRSSHPFSISKTIDDCDDSHLCASTINGIASMLLILLAGALAAGQGGNHAQEPANASQQQEEYNNEVCLRCRSEEEVSIGSVLSYYIGTPIGRDQDPAGSVGCSKWCSKLHTEIGIQTFSRRLLLRRRRRQKYKPPTKKFSRKEEKEKIKVCAKFGGITHGTCASSSSSVSCSCSSGYKYSGSTMHCMNGFWRGTPPACVPSAASLMKRLRGRHAR